MTNEMIAVEVMGWEEVEHWDKSVKWFGKNGLISEGGYCIPIPNFLNDHNAAMMVVEKMFKDGWCHQSGQNKEGVYWFEFWRDDVYEDHKVLNKSLCHAICEAALKAKGK